MTFLLVWLAFGVVGLIVELALYFTGRHGAPEAVRYTARNAPMFVILVGIITILSGPLQLATLAATWRKRD